MSVEVILTPLTPLLPNACHVFLLHPICASPTLPSESIADSHSAYIPPVPAVPDHAQDNATDDTSDSSAYMSPRQTQLGAMTLAPEDIRSRITAGKIRNGSQDNNGSGFAEIMSALNVER